MNIREAYPNWDEYDSVKDKLKIFYEKLEKFVKENNLIKLKSDYFNMSSYYWDNKNKIMYEIDRGYFQEIFNCKAINDQHIAELNNLY